MEKGFEYLDHTADVWVHAWAPDLEGAFEECVYGLMDTMVDKWAETVEGSISKAVNISDMTKGALLINFLSEFLFLFDTELFLARNVSITRLEATGPENWELEATVLGETFDRAKHFPDTEVKAITYSYLEIKERESRTEIKIVYDI